MQSIILCPKCHVQVKKDNLGELICPNCNARLCPKAHIFDGKICPHCGWEDPNYFLWQKAQKTRQQSPESKKLDGPPQDEPHYTCPNCGISVDITHKDCPGCGLLGAKYRAAKGVHTGTASTAAISPPTSARPFLDKIPTASPKKRYTEPTQSPLLKELAKAERREWEFPPLRRFVRPVLASLLVCIVLSSLALGGYYGYKLIRETLAQPGQGQNTNSILPFTNTKSYTLRAIVSQDSGGKIGIENIEPPPTNGEPYQPGAEITLPSVEPGSQITLIAIPDDCYVFDGGHWEIDGNLHWSNPITITMDSDKSITAHFMPKDTTPPAISEVQTPTCSDTSAIITWITDKPATSYVEYGETKDYGLSTTPNDELTTNHKVRLTELEDNTTYYLMLKSIDKCGNEASETKTLTTLRHIHEGNRVGERAPDFTLSCYSDDNPESPNKGQTVSLSDFQGKKILLNFWSTRCGPCLAEFPFIRATYYGEQCNENAGNLAVFAVAIDNRPDRIKLVEDKYQDEYGRFTFPILLDTTLEPVKNKYGIWQVPTTFFIDSDGIIREINIGRFKTKEEIEVILKTLD